MLSCGKIGAVLVLAGDMPLSGDLDLLRLYAQEGALLIAADGGVFAYEKAGVIPHIIIGDGDSGGGELFAEAKRIEYPAAKDFTDGQAALTYAVENSREKILVLGAFGGRTDQFFANLMLPLHFGEAAERFVFVHGDEAVYYCLHKLVLQGKAGQTVSLLALCPAEGIKLKGFSYPLSNYTLLPGSSRGISNVFCQDTGEISVAKGALMVIHFFRQEEVFHA